MCVKPGRIELLLCFVKLMISADCIEVDRLVNKIVLAKMLTFEMCKFRNESYTFEYPYSTKRHHIQSHSSYIHVTWWRKTIPYRRTPSYDKTLLFFVSRTKSWFYNDAIWYWCKFRYELHFYVRVTFLMFMEWSSHPTYTLKHLTNTYFNSNWNLSSKQTIHLKSEDLKKDASVWKM